MFKNWEFAMHLTCYYPCSLTNPTKLTKLLPQTHRTEGYNKPSFLEGNGPCMQRVHFFDTLNMSKIKLLNKSYKHHFHTFNRHTLGSIMYNCSHLWHFQHQEFVTFISLILQIPIQNLQIIWNFEWSTVNSLNYNKI